MTKIRALILLLAVVASYGCAGLDQLRDDAASRTIVGSRTYPQPGPERRTIVCTTYRYPDGGEIEECY